MSDDRGTTSIKVIPFSGKAIDWPVWSEHARARRKDYKKILRGKEVVPHMKRRRNKSYVN